ncbi:hypothetical protein P12x_004854 [Tundrisphaera lichenicola]|uniref:PIN-like domain-containing protein n=1 Tax=Tundrisphaera lichenicola TaxID=2029860 RepID=UPI003EBECC59
MIPTTARFLFDECMGKPSIEPLSKLIGMGRGEKPEVGHLLDIVPSGTPDEVWIPQIARDGWLLITTDGGRTPNKKRGEKLPRLCARYAITHILLSSAVHSRTAFEKLLTVLSVWYALVDIADKPTFKGNRYALEPLHSGERGKGRLIPRDIPGDLLTLREEYLRSLEATKGRSSTVLRNPEGTEGSGA